MYKKGSYKKVLNSDVARISRTTKYRIQSRRGHYTTKNNTGNRAEETVQEIEYNHHEEQICENEEDDCYPCDLDLCTTSQNTNDNNEGDRSNDDQHIDERQNEYEDTNDRNEFLDGNDDDDNDDDDHDDSDNENYLNDFPINEIEGNMEIDADGNDILDPFVAYNELYKVIQSPEILNTITTPTVVSRGELIMIYLKYAIVNNLSHTSVEQLFKSVNSIFASHVLPESRYMIDKMFFTTSYVNYHALCSDCNMYLGTFVRSDREKECNICKKVVSLRDKYLNNFFVTFNVNFDIKELLESNSEYYKYVVQERTHENGIFKDIYDGIAYRKFVNNLDPEVRKQYATCIFNCDGAVRFENSPHSAYPIYLMINEVPLHVRTSQTIVSGLWFGKGKPDMNVFLQAFVEQMNDMNENGIPCYIDNKLINIKPYVICCCVDSVARAPMQGITLYNGECGCAWCLQKGKYIPRVGSTRGAWKYPLLTVNPNERTEEHMLQCMKLLVNPVNNADEVQEVEESLDNENHDNNDNEMVELEESSEIESNFPITFGVKSVSPLINLKEFDIVSGFSPDPLHFAYLGIAKQLTNYWFIKKNSPLSKTLNKEYLKKIDKLLEKISVPHQSLRLTRSVTDRSYWKGKEWENWILYYSLPILKLYLEPKLWKHWSLFVEIIHISLQTVITITNLQHLESLVKKFLLGTETHYTKYAMTYNVHQLQHWVTSLGNWGPSYCHTTYPFESANGKLLDTIHSAKGVTHQVARSVCFKKCDTILRSKILPFSSPRIKELYLNLSGNITKKTYKLNTIRYFGSAKKLEDTVINQLNLSRQTVSYKKIVKDKCIYSIIRSKMERSDNSYAEMKDGSFIKIKLFIVDEVTNSEYTLCQTLITEKAWQNNCPVFKRIIHRNNDFFAVDTNDIKTICVFMKVENVEYICSFPNVYSLE